SRLFFFVCVFPLSLCCTLFPYTTLFRSSVDFVYLGNSLPSFTLPGNLKVIYEYETWHTLAQRDNKHPIFSLNAYHNAAERDPSLNLVRVSNSDLLTESFANLQIDRTVVFVLETSHIHGMADQR